MEHILNRAEAADVHIPSPERLRSSILDGLQIDRVERVEGTLDILAEKAVTEKDVRAVEELQARLLTAKGNIFKTLRALSGVLVVAFAMPTGTEKPTHGTGSFSERGSAAQELKERGVTSYQHDAYVPSLSDALSRGTYPIGYRGGDVTDIFEGAFAVVHGTFVDVNSKRIEATSSQTEFGLVTGSLEAKRARARRNLEHRLDAWNTYLGVPQKNETFGISEHRPSQSTDDRYYYNIPSFLEDVAKVEAEEHPEGTRLPVQVLLDALTNGTEGKTLLYDKFSGVMGNFTLSQGEDEHGSYIAYWDRWNLEGSLEGSSGFIGKPYEIYDRIYYNPQTFEVIN